MADLTFGPGPAWAVAALDVGGSSVKGGVVRRDAQGVLTAADISSTPLESTGPARELIHAIASAAVRALDGASAPARLAIGFPGPFDYETGMCRIRNLAKFDGLYGLDVGRLLAGEVGRPVAIRFCNDAEAFALGEASLGAGRGYSRVVCLTLGTGLGSAFIAGGRRVVQGGVPPAGELNQVAFQGQPADDVFSTRGLLDRLRLAGLPGAIEACAAMAAAGDAVAQAVFARFGAELGLFIEPHCARFEAGAVIVGGGIGRAWPLFGPHLAARLGCRALQPARPDEAALLGAVLACFGGFVSNA